MSEEPKGMGGWLLLFTITLTIRPVLLLVGALGALALMVDKPGSTLVFNLIAAGSLAMAIFTGWMAYVFWRLKPNAVRLLRIYFGTLLVYCLFIAAVRFVPHEASSDTTEFLNGTAKSAIGSVVYIAVWTTYFRKSRRVANTFGQPVATA